ncbi:imidazole glycerol phosphate synthase subunit HisF [Hwanghaeella sp.]|uniref:imidazole glycerol phosphate synthase subunit HisF n=1 Tax=Hwanghaeella sp. TaxID=2605943 RepID=UPI003CCBA51E
MSKFRLIARLDVKAPDLIKSVNLEGVRKLGDPAEFAKRYYSQGIDEILYMDVVASLYRRNSLADLVYSTTQDVFVPITVGGGIRSLQDVEAMMRSGADKVAVNTAAIQRPDLIREIARTFGSQCIVLSIEAKSIGPDRWEAYVDNGREKTGKDAIEWAREAVDLGAGEVLVTSVDREGTRKGFDIALMKAVSGAVPVPVIASGGMGKPDHLIDIHDQAAADAVAIADVLHYNRLSLDDIRQAALAGGVEVRTP